MIKEFNFNEFKGKANVWFNDKKWRLKRFYNEHRQEIIVFGPIIIGTGGAIVKKLIRSHNLRLEEQLKTRFIYDRSLGAYFELRKKPTTNQLLEIERRKKSGEKLGEILTSMKLLK